MVRTFALLSSALSLSATVSAASNNSQSLLSSGHTNLGEWKEAYNKASTYAKGLTTAEKISLITGGSAGNVSALTFKDGSASILDYYYVTTFPFALAMAMSWNKDNVYDQTQALASEMAAKGINIANAPTAQPLGRSPWGGRSGETYGPDAYLNGILFGKATAGISSAGVVPGGKHFLLNEQETNREPSGNTQAYSAVADDKTLHETYLFPFYDSVYNGLGGVMCGMNRVNGTFSCESEDLLSGYLKTELGFPGLVFGDVGGQKTGIPSAIAGLDYGSSQYWSNSTIMAGLNNGSLTEARLNDMVMRNVMGYYRLDQDNGSFPSVAGQTDYVDARKNHGALARQYGAESIVLLKNENNALPLKSPKSIAVFGRHAGSASYGPNTAMNVNGSPDTFEGHMAQVGGSGQGSFAYLVTPQFALTERAMTDGNMLRFMLNDTVVSSSSGRLISGDSEGSAATQTTDGYAENADVCLVFVNAYSGEGGDRSELRNADKDGLVEEVASNCANTIVVVTTTGPRILDSWITNTNITGVLYTGALGQASGHAITDVLYGAVNPSGKLVHTIAKNESDYEHFAISEASVIDFSEGNLLDYKWFDHYNVTPRFEFGYGLSYTTFSLGSNISAEANKTALAHVYAEGERNIGGRADLWDTVASVSASVTNTGNVTGAEVAQLYVSFPAAANKPVRELRGFEKVVLAPGETKEVSFPLRRRDLSVWDVDAQEWAVLRGGYKMHVGSSSRDLKAVTQMTV